MRKLSLGLLALFVFSIPFVDVFRAVTTTLMIATFSCTFATCILEKRINKPPTLLYVVCALACWQLTSYFWSYDTSATLERARIMLYVLATVWVLTELCRSKRERIIVAQAFVFGCFVLFVFVAQAYFSGSFIDNYRSAPDNINPNGAGVVFSIGAALAMLVIDVRPSKLGFWVSIAFIPIGFLGVILTASRAGFILISIASLGTFFVLKHISLIPRITWIAILLAGITLVFFTFADNQELSNNLDRITFQTDTNSLRTMTHRTEIWAVAVRHFTRNPLLGDGAGAFAIAADHELGRLWVVHNIYLESAAETGLLGLFLLLAAFSVTGWSILRSSGQQKGLLLILWFVIIGIGIGLSVGYRYEFWFAMTFLLLPDVDSRQEVEGDKSAKQIPLFANPSELVMDQQT